ncbi:MAG: hypothetical protein JWO67_4624 [Streptosporangiaceae bacterium]|jgi:hypothetical protein|nr:hypothetical protein [Streptosporangiaceae bacterium]
MVNSTMRSQAVDPFMPCRLPERPLRRCVGPPDRGSFQPMETDIVVRDVEEQKTRSGHTRYVVHDAEGREYTTFRPQIGREAHRYEGRRARIGYHEEDRGGFHNVYLDSIAQAPQGRAHDPGEGDRDLRGQGKNPDEAGWDTAVEAAPWLLGGGEAQQAVSPERLYETLRPFKDLVADDIRGEQGDPDSEDES